jgi:hypothetical protein
MAWNLPEPRRREIRHKWDAGTQTILGILLAELARNILYFGPGDCSKSCKLNQEQHFRIAAKIGLILGKSKTPAELFAELKYLELE